MKPSGQWSRREGALRWVLPAFSLVIGACGSPLPEPPPNPVADAFAAKVIRNRIRAVADPYASNVPAPRAYGPDAVCALRYEADRVHYRIETFANREAAAAAGYILTHAGPCGTCSTLRDLAVYLRHPDLTTPVRRCAARVVVKDWSMDCLGRLGFTVDCAESWYANARHTGEACFGICLQSWITDEPFNRTDGSLNPCLACDEERSGPIFKRAAGRTRRSSGIESAIGRQSGETFAIVHDYY